MSRLKADVRRDRRRRTRLSRRCWRGWKPDALWRELTASSPRPKATSRITVLTAHAVERLSELSPPAHDLCNYAAYVRRGGFVGVQTKRGCPFQCIYCVYPQLEGRRYRLRSPEAVVEEIENVAVRSKVRHFFFVDSVFNDPREHALAICRELGRRRLPVRWSAYLQPGGL